MENNDSITDMLKGMQMIQLYQQTLEGKNRGLHLCAKKIKNMHINGRENAQSIKVNNKNLEYVEKFIKYLSSIKDKNVSCDMKTRNAMAKKP